MSKVKEIWTKGDFNRMEHKKLVLRPKCFIGYEKAFSEVEKLNRQLYERAEEFKNGKRSHTFFSQTKVCGVVVSEIASTKMLCFLGDEDELQWVSGLQLPGKKRYLLPVAEVVEVVNLCELHIDIANQLRKIYNCDFRPKRPATPLIQKMDKTYSPEEVLGLAIVLILEKGSGGIPREFNSFEALSATDDKSYQLLVERAASWMQNNKVEAYAY